jgi:ABC-type nitrate/sulfonate/bicarbonate transport system substrate-binding protein
MTSRKQAFAVVVLILIASLTLIGGYLAVLAPSTMRQNSSVQVTRFIGALADNEAPFFAADAEGFYEQNHISLAQVVTGNTNVAIQALAADNTGLAFVWASVIYIVLLQSQNPNSTQLISVASTGHKNPLAVMYLKSSGISKPSDLAGKLVGMIPSSLPSLMFEAFLKQNGLYGRVHTVTMGISELFPALLSKKVDAIVRFADGFGSLSANAKEMNEEAGFLLLSDYGLPNLGFGIIVQKKLVSEHPDIVKEIVNASMQGIRFCVLEREPCVADFVKANPTFKFNESLSDLGLLINFTLGPPFDDPSRVANLTALQLGWHDKSEIAQIIEFAKEIYNLPTELSPQSFYTNQFVEQP